MVRECLLEATLSAARFNPGIRAIYRRLKDGGKPDKVARIAAARKLQSSSTQPGVAQQLPSCSRTSSHLLKATNHSEPSQRTDKEFRRNSLAAQCELSSR